jgi:SNF2 family DNA or RNA helicase
MLTATLHPYQEEAVERALERGSLLVAYEMGLGKTVIALAVIEELLAGRITQAMVVVPANLRYQWAQQIAKLTDVPTRVVRVKDGDRWQEITVPTEDACLIVEGPKKTREALLRRAATDRPDYVLLGYESVVNDWSLVRRVKSEVIVLDEATAIKTFKAQRTRKIKRLTAPFRLALTGTPVENGKPEEIFSIMQWVDEDVLGRWDLFDRSYVVRNTFGGVMRYKNMPVLHAKLAQAMVRKRQLDPDVAPFLPKVQETHVPVAMDERTRAAYRTIAADLLAELQSLRVTGTFDLFAYYHGQNAPGENTAQGRIMARMQALDMLLCHPDLIVSSGMDYEEAMEAKNAGSTRKVWPGSKYCYEVWQSGLLDEVTQSPKLLALTDTVATILASNPANKVIIFSAWRGMLDLIEDALGDVGVVQYHGGMSAAQKASAQARFESDPQCRVFLSSHAGAYGTDLYAANYLVNFDLSWQAGRQDQINARHQRASSDWQHVYVVNMLVQDSTEVRRYESLSFKRAVGSAVIDNVGADQQGRVENPVVSLTAYLQATAA